MGRSFVCMTSLRSLPPILHSSAVTLHNLRNVSYGFPVKGLIVNDCLLGRRTGVSVVFMQHKCTCVSAAYQLSKLFKQTSFPGFVQVPCHVPHLLIKLCSSVTCSQQPCHCHAQHQIFLSNRLVLSHFDEVTLYMFTDSFWYFKFVVRVG